MYTFSYQEHLLSTQNKYITVWLYLPLGIQTTSTELGQALDILGVLWHIYVGLICRCSGEPSNADNPSVWPSPLPNLLDSGGVLIETCLIGRLSRFVVDMSELWDMCLWVISWPPAALWVVSLVVMCLTALLWWWLVAVFLTGWLLGNDVSSLTTQPGCRGDITPPSWPRGDSLPVDGLFGLVGT